MKTIEEAKNEYLQKCKDEEIDVYMGDEFIAGINFAQRWISVEEELPEVGTEFIAKSSDNIVQNVKVSPSGAILESKKTNHLIFLRTSKSDSDCIEVLRKHKVTHWRPIELK